MEKCIKIHWYLINFFIIYKKSYGIEKYSMNFFRMNFNRFYEIFLVENINTTIIKQSYSHLNSRDFSSLFFFFFLFTGWQFFSFSNSLTDIKLSGLSPIFYIRFFNCDEFISDTYKTI